jgi:hypothetical protein
MFLNVNLEFWNFDFVYDNKGLYILLDSRVKMDIYLYILFYININKQTIK